MRSVFVILGSAMLAACQTMTPTECRLANWVQIGQQDGQAGKLEQISSHVDGCIKQNVPVSAQSVAQYRTGYQQGLAYFCQKDRIIEMTLQGEGDLAVCPLQLQQNLRPYWQAANAIYEITQDRLRAEQEQRRLETELLDHKTTDTRKHDIRRRLRDLDRQLIDLRNDQTTAEQRLDRLKQYGTP